MQRKEALYKMKTLILILLFSCLVLAQNSGIRVPRGSGFGSYMYDSDSGKVDFVNFDQLADSLGVYDSTLVDARFDAVEDSNTVYRDELDSITSGAHIFTNIKGRGDLNLLANNIAYVEERPIVSFVFDDYPDSVYSIFRDLFNNRGVDASASILNPPTAGQRTKLLTLQSEGWELETHVDAQTHLTFTRAQINNFIDSIKTWQIGQGYNVSNGNWLGGVSNSKWQGEARKYYRSMRRASGSGDYNNLPINQFAVVGRSIDAMDFNECTGIVDLAVINNYWVVFYTHAGLASQWTKYNADGTPDAGGLYNWQWVDSLVGYIKAQTGYGTEDKIIILPKDEALDYTENVIEIGDFFDYDSLRNVAADHTTSSIWGRFFKLSKTGRMSFPNSDYLNSHIRLNSIKDTAGISWYPPTDSYMMVDAGCTGCAYPAASGLLMTFNTANTTTFRMQLFKQAAASTAGHNLWIRHWTGSAWTTWQQIVSSNDMLMWATTGTVAETTFSNYNLKGVTRFSVSVAGWNYPATNGMAIIDRAINDFANMRWFMEHNNNKLWFSGGRSATNQDFVRVTSQTATVTYTIDFAEISAGTTLDSSITYTPLNANVSDASVGDVVIASPNTSIETGLTWSAYISATNTIKLRLANVTTGAIDPASKSWTIIVVKQ